MRKTASESGSGLLIIFSSYQLQDRVPSGFSVIFVP